MGKAGLAPALVVLDLDRECTVVVLAVVRVVREVVPD